MSRFDLRDPFAISAAPAHFAPVDYHAAAAALSLSLGGVPGPAPSPPSHWEPGPPATTFSHHERNQDRYSPPRTLPSSRRSVGPAATTIGYMESSEYQRPSRTRSRHGNRDRERDRDRDRDRDKDVFFRDSLKQRMERKSSIGGDGLVEGGAHRQSSQRQQQHQQHHHSSSASSSHHRTRSLSLSRHTTSSSPELERFRSMGLEDMVFHESDEGDEGYDEGDGGDGPQQHHRPRRRAGYGNVAKYYAQHERWSMSSPRVALGGAGWPLDLVSSRPGSRSPESRTERVKYLGGGGSAFHPQLQFEGPGMGLPRIGRDAVSMVGGTVSGSKLVNPRVPSARRSGSFETVRGSAATEVGRRTGRSSPGKRGNSKFRPQYKEVRVLIITWEFHDLRTEDYTAPPAADYVSLEDETVRLRETLQSYGYKVSEFLIPMDHPVEKTQAKLKDFCRHAKDDTLLMVYYHGHGSMDEQNELVFSSHDHPDNAEWSQAAAAELYAALFPEETCSNSGHGSLRKAKKLELRKKYERYRPVSSIRWDTIRDPLISASCDVLFILDCCAAGGANLRHVDWQPDSGVQFTKHLFAACGFESSTSDDMTAAMCEILDEWVHDYAGNVTAGANSQGIVVGGQGPGPGSGVLTTKRLHQLMEDRLQKRVVGSQPIFKQLLPHDPEQYITLPNLKDREVRERRGSRSATSARGVSDGLRRGNFILD